MLCDLRMRPQSPWENALCGLLLSGSSTSRTNAGLTRWSSRPCQMEESRPLTRFVVLRIGHGIQTIRRAGFTFRRALCR